MILTSSLVLDGLFSSNCGALEVMATSISRVSSLMDTRVQDSSRVAVSDKPLVL